MLTPKQQLFVKEYLVDLNAKQAAIRAGYSERTAEKIGSENLSKPEVAAAIEAGMSARAAKVEVKAERVLQEIVSMAFWDPADLVAILRKPTPEQFEAMSDEARGALVTIEGEIYMLDGIRDAMDIKLLPEQFRRAIVGWGYDRNQNFTLKLADKSKALDQLARHLGLFHDKLDVTVTDLGDRLNRAFARLSGDAQDGLAAGSGKPRALPVTRH